MRGVYIDTINSNYNLDEFKLIGNFQKNLMMAIKACEILD